MMSWRSFSLAAAVLTASALPAFAGLEFTDFAATGTGNGSDAAVRFNGSASNAFTGVVLPQNFSAPGTNLLTVSANLSDPSLIGVPTPFPLTAQINFRYTGNPFSVVNYGPTVGTSPGYNMVIQFGTVTIPTNTTLKLQSVGFEENGSGTFASWNTNTFITAAMTDGLLFLLVDPSAVPASLRDSVTTVRLDFILTIGTGATAAPSFGINAVVNPEPGTMALFGLGLVGLAGAVRARRKSRVARAPTK